MHWVVFRSSLLLAPTLLVCIPNKGVAQPRPLDPKAAEQFCDVGFVRTSIEVNIEKLLKLGVKTDPKMLVAVQGQAAVQLALLTQYCRMTAIGLMSPQEFQQKAGSVTQYNIDLEAVTQRAASDAKASPTPAAPQLSAKAGSQQLGLNQERSINISGDLQFVIRGLLETYNCGCSLQKK